jgi:hypothetical protein
MAYHTLGSPGPQKGTLFSFARSVKVEKRGSEPESTDQRHAGVTHRAASLSRQRIVITQL